ncbi:HypC/HybG/HupF family hydrogenase formation chaperone [Kordiimonas lipolytica]|uniref:HypC/HybG/HupF family hydrogenase formation chaperone n=1 Tax=Kordiimonas lipolytica TaxID=1662421 RepID=A0ABV8UBU0_9PROT|nr:HypC/HybG/HupF family hydrogenase formation chaperone [Kordiimonas lipolytica]
MCVGLPMKVLEAGFGQALCDYRGEQRTIDTILVGNVEPGQWVMVFINAAREIISEDDALKSLNALIALEKVMQGETDIDHLFADLIAKEAT